MKIVFNSETGLLTIDGRTLKLVTEEGVTEIEGMQGEEETGCLAGMAVTRLQDALLAIQQAERITHFDPNYCNVEDAWSLVLVGNTLDKIHEVLL